MFCPRLFPLFFKERLLDGNNEKGKSHIYSIFRKVKSLRICLHPSLCLHFWYRYQSPKLSRRVNSPGPGGHCTSLHLLCVTCLHSRFSQKLPPVFNTTALPLCVNNSKYQKPSVPCLKHSILEILDYRDRVKKKVDLTLYNQKTSQ